MSCKYRGQFVGKTAFGLTQQLVEAKACSSVLYRRLYARNVVEKNRLGSLVCLATTSIRPDLPCRLRISYRPLLDSIHLEPKLVQMNYKCINSIKWRRWKLLARRIFWHCTQQLLQVCWCFCSLRSGQANGVLCCPFGASSGQVHSSLSCPRSDWSVPSNKPVFAATKMF